MNTLRLVGLLISLGVIVFGGIGLLLWVHGIRADVDEFIDHVDSRLVAYGERLQKLSAADERPPRHVAGEPALALTGDAEDPVPVDPGDPPTDPEIPTVETPITRPVPYRRTADDRPRPEQAGHPATVPHFQPKPDPTRTGRHRARG